MDKQIFADTNIPFVLMRSKKQYSKICIASLITALICLLCAVLTTNVGLLISTAVFVIMCLKANKTAKELDLRAQDLKECNISLTDNWLSVQQAAENGRYETINVKYDEVASVVEQNQRPGVPMFYVCVRDDDAHKESQYFIDGVEQKKWNTVEIDGRNYDPTEFRRYYLEFISMLPPTTVIVKTEEQTSWFKKTSKAGAILAIIAAVMAPVIWWFVMH